MGLTFEISTGFGWVGIGIVLFVGLALVVFRPYWAFLFGLFVCTAASINTGITRTEELGAYFNLADACVLVMIMACLWEKKRTLLFPAPALILSAVLIMGFLNSLMHTGLAYEALRSLRWGITLPLMIFLAANLVQDQHKVRSLLVTLLLAAIVAEAQHLFLVLGYKSMMAENVEVTRTMQFIRSGSDLWLVAGFYLVGGVIPHPWVQSAIGALFLAGVVTLQTRSIGLGLVGAWLVYYLWFLKGPHAFRWQRFKGLLPVFILGLIMLVAMGISAVISGYGARYTETVEAGEGTQSRWNALNTELHDWLQGNILIGRGLSYYSANKYRGNIGRSGTAYGHLGYVTYLSQLGLIGFLAYGIWLPLVVVSKARRLLQQPHAPPEVIHLAALTGATFIYYPLMFLFSGSFLTIMYVPAILVGAVWGMTSLQFEAIRVPVPETPSPRKELPKSIIAEPYQATDRSRPVL
jgi:hypothetical protein